MSSCTCILVHVVCVCMWVCGVCVRARVWMCVDVRVVCACVKHTQTSKLTNAHLFVYA